MPTPLPTLPGVYYCYLHGKNGGLTTGNTYTFKTSVPAADAPTDQAWAQALANSLTANWDTTLRPSYPSTVVGWDSRVYALGHPTLPATLGHTSGSGAGGSQLAPISCAAIVRHNVLRRGRGSQSHTSISPLPKTSVLDDGENLADGPRTFITTEFENFIAGVIADMSAIVTSGEMEYVQLSKKGSGTTYQITGSFCEALLGTERSRTLRP